MQRTNRSSAFTIIELTIVITVISILAVITIVSYGNWRERVAKSEVISDLKNAARVMSDERNFKNTYPLTLPSYYKASQNVTITLKSTSNAAQFCINGVSKVKASVIYFISSSQSDPSVGQCP